MIIFYTLEVSTTKPTVFRVAVIRSLADNDADIAARNSKEFQLIGVYDNPDKLTEALEPYLRMEEGA